MALNKDKKQLYKKRILVTGGLGFIGSNYLNLVVPKNPKTLYINLDAMTYAADETNVTVSKSKNYRFEKGDIRDVGRLEEVFKRYQPTGVLHFAAESHVDKSIENPNIFLETNVIGTSNLLRLAREWKVKRFLYISTDEVYGALTSKKGQFTEQTPIAPRNPYSASKAGGELLVRAYFETFGLPVVITRSSNNYGPNQDKTKLIPLFISNLLAGKKVPVYGKGKNIRDWIYVEDNVRAVDLVYKKGKVGETYNIGGGNEIENIEITKRLLALTGRDESAIEYVTDRLGHDFRYALSSKKIEKELGWKPKMSFETGLKRTLKFYSERQK